MTGNSSDFCIWERLSGFTGDFEDILSVDLSDTIQTLTIKDGDVGFSSTDCGTWTKIG